MILFEPWGANPRGTPTFVIDPEGPALAWTDILALARSHSVSADDAAYIELALRLCLPLATTDATPARAATAAGVPTFTP